MHGACMLTRACVQTLTLHRVLGQMRGQRPAPDPPPTQAAAAFRAQSVADESKTKHNALTPPHSLPSTAITICRVWSQSRDLGVRREKLHFTSFLSIRRFVIFSTWATIFPSSAAISSHWIISRLKLPSGTTHHTLGQYRTSRSSRVGGLGRRPGPACASAVWYSEAAMSVPDSASRFHYGPAHRMAWCRALSMSVPDIA
eukprot:3522648-Rhodomonas_salina.6